MAASTTEQKAKAQESRIMKDITIKDLNEFLAEDDNGMSRKRKVMETLYETAVYDKDVRALINLADRAFGKPADSLDITSDGKAVTGLAVVGNITKQPDGD